MTKEFTFKLILNREEYSISSNFLSFDDIDDQIHTTLITKGQYKVKSNVSKIVFQSFLNNWINNEIPNIRNDNIDDYILLSEEFDRMKAIISLYKKLSTHPRSSYTHKKNQKLNFKSEKKLFKLNKTIRKFHLIIDHLFNNKGIDSHSRFLEIKADLYNACRNGKVKLVNLLTQKEMISKNGFSFIINEAEKTAGIFRVFLFKDDYFIPRTVEYHNDEYLITEIHQSAFKNTNANTITFDENSEIRTIEKYAFYHTNISTINIPEHVKYIGKYAFAKCDELKAVSFHFGSELEVIESNAFNGILISQLSLPATILQLKEGWCSDILSFHEVKIYQPLGASEYVANISFFDDNFLIGKSNVKNDFFDVLILARRDIKSAKIPEFVRVIGPYAFENCTCLETIEFSDNSNLEIIEHNAFSKSSIQAISIPNTVTKIGDNCFSECKNLKKIEFSSNSKLESIGRNAFISSLLRINIFGKDSSLFNRFLEFYKKKYSFLSNSQPQTNEVSTAQPKKFIESLSIPSSIAVFKEGWCYNTPNLTDIKIIKNETENVILIDDRIVIGKSDPYTDEYDVLLFAARDIETVVIPSFIKRISSYAFCDCVSLQKVEFSKDSQLEVIEKSAFSGTSIKTITIPPHVIEIEDFAFFDCKLLSEVNFSMNSDLKIIGNFVFTKSMIANIVISSNLERIEKNFFYGIPNLTSLSVSPSNRYYQYIDNKFLVAKSNSLSSDYDVLVFVRRNIEDAIIPSFIKIIAPFAFSQCKNLQKVEFPIESELFLIDKNAFESSSITKISIPSHVRQIGKYAFNNCHNIETVEFSDDSELELIGDHAFDNSSIERITIPQNVYHIGHHSFQLCGALKKIEFCSSSKLHSISTSTFEFCGIESILIPSSVLSIDSRAFMFCDCLSKVEFMDDSNLIFIGKSSFSHSCIESIKIPRHVSHISERAFNECSVLQTVDFSENSELIFIDELAFSHTSIKSILIPPTVFSIGSHVFKNCYKLETVEFSEDTNVKFISQAPFHFSSIVNLSIPDNLNIISNDFFSGISHLVNINLFSCSHCYHNDCNLFYYENQFIISKSSSDDTYKAILFARRDIKEAKIPSFIKIISFNAFENCSQLESVDFSESKVQLFCKNSFANSEIKRITIPEETIRICDHAFSGCQNLEIVEIPFNSQLRLIDDYAFYYTPVKSISIPAHVKVLGKNAFSNCGELERIDFQANSELFRIDEHCFKKTNIASICLPDRVAAMKIGTFYGCNELKIIEINENCDMNEIDLNIFNSHRYERLIMIPHSKKI